MGVAITFDDNVAVEVTPGGQAACPVRVENTGQVVDAVLLDLLGDAAEWARVEPAQVNLLPGASTSVRIVFAPPRSAALAPGEVPFALRAMSMEDPDGSRIDEGVVRVGEFSELGVSLVPRSATGRRSARFRLIVENRGNHPERMTVEAVDPDAKLTFQTKPVLFSAPAGTATFVRLTAAPRKTFFKGPSRTLPFEVSASPDGGEPVSAQGLMLEKQILPEWLLPLLGIAVLAAAAVLALWFAVLRPVVHSAATAAAEAGNAAKSAARAAKTRPTPSPPASPPASPSALDVTLPDSTILDRTTELATVTGAFPKPGAGAVPRLVWTSSAPKVAKVSQSGVVTGVGVGQATITATTTGKRSRSGASPTSPGSPQTASLSAIAAARPPAVSGAATVNVVGPLHISSKVLPEAAMGRPYSATLAASGGTGAFTWSVTSGSLPAGLSLTPGSGEITGTPTALGASAFTVHLADAGPPAQFTTAKITLTVVKPLAVSTSSLPDASVGAGYPASLAAVGGTPPYRWSISPGSGSLPAGLQLDAKTGAITGTPTSAGASHFVVDATDAASPGQSATASLSISVVNPLTLTTLTLPTAVIDSPYSQPIAAFGGLQPYTWSVASGSLPAGVTLSPVSGALSGTPTTTGTSTFAIQATDASHPALSATRTFTVNVVKALTITTSSLPTTAVGQSYSAQLTAAGGVAPYVWTLEGTLPPGLTLSPGGAVTGEPTTTGDFAFTVQAVDSSSPPLSATASLSITVTSPLKITTTSLREAVTGQSYSRTLQATGGTQPYTWYLLSGSLPAGLTLSPGSGIISGTPLATGTSPITIWVQDSETPVTHSASLSTSITVVEPLRFTEPALPDAVQGAGYSPVTPTHVSGGSGAYAWYITSGTLPAGLSLDPHTGVISGTVSAAAAMGAQNFTLTLADAKDPSLTDSKQETITVFAPLQVASPNFSALAGFSFSQDLSSYVSGGRAPYTYSAPPIDRLTVAPATGVISGIPDAPCPAYTIDLNSDPATVVCNSTFYQTALTVTDADGHSVTVPLTLTATVRPLTFVPVSSLPNVHDLQSYSAYVTAGGASPSGGYGSSVAGVGGYSFSTSAVSGPTSNNGLPCNLDSCNTGGYLSINSQTGEITGELTAPPALNSTWTFNVTITDTDPLNPSNQISVSFQLSITNS